MVSDWNCEGSFVSLQEGMEFLGKVVTVLERKWEASQRKGS